MTIACHCALVAQSSNLFVPSFPHSLERRRLGGCYPVIYCFNTQDSMLYCLYSAPTSYYPNSNFASPGGNSTMNLFVDINGLRKPNVLGRDMFVFAVGYHTGIVVPTDGQAVYKDYAENEACRGVPAQYKESCVSSYMTSYETNKTNPSYYYCFNKKSRYTKEGKGKFY